MRRGRGAWRDAGRIVIHQGHDILDVQTGALCPVTDFASKYIYPKGIFICRGQVPALASKGLQSSKRYANHCRLKAR